MNNTNKSILLTGTAGFIGSNFVPYFLEKYPNYNLVNLDLLTYAGDLENLTECEQNPRYKYLYPNSDFDNLNIVGKYIIGHSHIQFQNNHKNYDVINSGSLGQNRKNLSVCEYLVIENDKIKLENMTLEFSDLIKQLEVYQYPSNLIEYYLKLSIGKES